MTFEVAITGVGYRVPERVVHNREFEARMATTDQWISERTGIRERRIADPEVALSDLAIPSGRQALDHAGLDPKDIDLVICGTSTPDMLMPSTAAITAHALGCTRAAAFDLEAACSGFVYALVVAEQFIRTGTYRNVLVIGGDILSKFINWDDRGTAILFADGAGAAVLSRSDRHGFLASTLGADGAGQDLIQIPLGSRTPPSGDKSLHVVHMKGREVYKWAVDNVPKILAQVADAAELTPADFDHIILHQANLRIIEAVSKRLGLRSDQMIVNVDRMANTSAGTIPIALAEAADQGRIKPGDRLCLLGFGSGLTWAATALTWTAPRPRSALARTATTGQEPFVTAPDRSDPGVLPSRSL